jgi:agmatine deiminase
VKYIPEWSREGGKILIAPKKSVGWCCFEKVMEHFLAFAKEIEKREKLYIISEEDFGIGETISGIPYNDSWARDSVGLFVSNAILNYQFNGWGGKFEFEDDNRITENLYKKGFFGEIPKIEVPLIVEGGAIETDGKTLLVTETSILNSNRPLNSRSEVEESFRKYFGISKIVWLKNSFLKGDDTDGHIDMLARFSREDRVLYSLLEVGKELEKKLEKASFRKLPNPEFRDFPATYLNFIFVKGAVLVPIYNISEDEVALQIFREEFPEREIVPIDSSLFIQQGGSLHCLSMEV